MHHSTSTLAWCIAFAWTLVMVSALPAQAQQGADVAARTHYDSGKTAVAEHRYADAYREFELGHALVPKPEFLFNMAECARKMGDPRRARTDYQAYLREAPDGQMKLVAQSRLEALGPAPKEPQSTAPQKPIDLQPTFEVVQPPTHADAAPLSDDDDDGSFFTSWPFWAAVGVAVVAGGIVAIVLTQQGGSSSASMCSGPCETVDFR